MLKSAKCIIKIFAQHIVYYSNIHSAFTGLNMTIEIVAHEVETKSRLGERIKSIRTSRKMTQKAFSASLGIAQGFLCAIERGRKTPSDTLMIAIQHLYKINREWLHSGEGEQGSSILNPVENTTKAAGSIPLLKSPPSSIDSLSHSEIDCHISMPEVPDNCFAFVYSGDFMTPSIRDLDLVIINPETKPASGDIVLIMGKWGDSFLRRYRSIGDETFFSADNSSYSTFKAEKGSKIIGVVDSVWRKIKY
jgi:SOS-response transcriptional repressors (RecA-mediated autopeptidases)